MRISIGLAAALVALGCASATAADLPVKAPHVVAPAVWNWTGCYIGINGGYAWGRSDHLNIINDSFTTPFNVRGGVFGGTVGCNYQWSPQFVLGVEGDFDWSGKKGSTADLGPAGNPAFTSDTKEKWLGPFAAASASCRPRLTICSST